MRDKIGIAVVTYNSTERFCATSPTLPQNVHKLIIVNDGTPYPNNIYPPKADVITHGRNLGVGCAKNTALRNLIQNGCDHIFIIEDDIYIKNENVFDEYIKAAEKSGLHHLMYGYHGPANVTQNGTPNPRFIIDYGDNIKIAFNTHCVGAFCYYHRGVIKNVGYMDEMFKNCWEHVEHSYRIVKLGLLPAYWNWPDIANSMDYLQEYASSELNTVIERTEEWKNNFRRGAEYFKHVHGYYPTTVPDTDSENIKEKLKTIKKNYSRC